MVLVKNHDMWYYIPEERRKAGEPVSKNKTQQELDFERKHEQDLQRLSGLRLIDDDFMAAVFEDPACAEFLLQIILKREDLKVCECMVSTALRICRGVPFVWIFWLLMSRAVHIISRFSAAIVAQAKNVPATTVACWMQTLLIRAAAMML